MPLFEIFWTGYNDKDEIVAGGEVRDESALEYASKEEAESSWITYVQSVKHYAKVTATAYAYIDKDAALKEFWDLLQELKKSSDVLTRYQATVLEGKYGFYFRSQEDEKPHE